MKKNLVEILVDKKITIIDTDTESAVSKVSFTFVGENDTESHNMVFSSKHAQDCCEHVYADFGVFDDYQKAFSDRYRYGEVLEKIVIKPVEEMGFLMCFFFIGKFRYSTGNLKIFVPCYNYQNGYYSDELRLAITNDGVESFIDITDLVEDHVG